ncbi:MBL fold metallo-hydrolase [Undibacterium sp. TJN19]|uniref:MBL fold metallo-hydrolase n=1 Tax=Undibacterium sp. TJN19 TaxID=3413055 RepID=UPI003BF22ADA
MTTKFKKNRQASKTVHRSRLMLGMAAGAMMLLAASIEAQAAVRSNEACWVETAAVSIDAKMGGADIRETKVWNSTISSVLFRHPQGDVLIDTGFGPNAEAQMNELPTSSRDFGLQIIAGAKNRKPLLAELAKLGELPEQVKRILITHAHYDHLGGTSELSAPIQLAAEEIKWLEQQSVQATITPPSLIASVKSRFEALPYDSGPFLSFDKSQNIYQDGSLVVVPLPGHTPGSLGVFIKLSKRQVFLIGDAANLLEAVSRGLDKNPAISAATDFDAPLADITVKRLAAFHRDHPEIAIIPAHDRDAFVLTFGQAPGCVTAFH